MEQKRPISAVAADIRKAWPKPYFGAVLYIDAMADLRDASDHYGADPAFDIIARFLANATTFRGEEARKLKAELKAIAGIK